MFFSRSVGLLRHWLLTCWQRWRGHMRIKSLIKRLLAHRFGSSKLVEWKVGSKSHVVAHATTGLFRQKHYLCLVDLDFERLAYCQEFSSVEQWSVRLEQGVVSIVVCHSLQSPWPEAYSFWTFDPGTNRLEEDVAAKMFYLASHND